jgi:hypothetical protein
MRYPPTAVATPIIVIKNPTNNFGYVTITVLLRVWIVLVDVAFSIPLSIRIIPKNIVSAGKSFLAENNCSSFSKGLTLISYYLIRIYVFLLCLKDVLTIQTYVLMVIKYNLFYSGPVPSILEC